MAIAVFLIHLPAVATTVATIILAKLGLGVLLRLGPLFVAALMFPSTAK
jgi:type IV secretion system protein VirB6